MVETIIPFIYTGAMLQMNKVLTSLKLRDCYIGPGDLRIVCTAVAKNTTLTSLDLSENGFDGQSITSLGRLPTMQVCSVYFSIVAEIAPRYDFFADQVVQQE